MSQLCDMHGMPRILCVDDDTYLTELLHLWLTREGFTVQTANTGAEALRLAHLELPDLALLDVNLPDMSGFDLCAQLRSQLRVPILMLTARQAEADVLTGLAEGADDYVTKPFTMRILVLRMQGLLRRAQAPGVAPATELNRFRLGDGWFNAEQNQIVLQSGYSKLTPTEGRILQLLMTNEGRVLPVERIMVRLWGYESDTSASVVKTHIRNLRMKVAAALGDRDVIHTVPGAGYMYQYDAERAAQPAQMKASLS